MPDPIRRIGVLTGGGDAPGLNAVIRAVVKAGTNANCAVIGLEDSFDGLIEPDRWRKLEPKDVTGILRVGGTILGTTNRGNPFGFDTAVSFATDAIDRLHVTAEAHHRIIVVEVMGRYAGWIALYSGVAGGADVILIPEIPYDLEKIARRIRDRDHMGARFSIVVAAEGARPIGGKATVLKEAEGAFVERLGGVAARVAIDLEKLTGKETRNVVLGHLQR